MPWSTYQSQEGIFKNKVTVNVGHSTIFTYVHKLVKIIKEIQQTLLDRFLLDEHHTDASNRSGPCVAFVCLYIYLPFANIEDCCFTLILIIYLFIFMATFFLLVTCMRILYIER